MVPSFLAVSLSYFIYLFLFASLLFLSPAPPHLLHLPHLILLLFHKWPLLFSISLRHSSTPFFPCSLLLLALHSQLSRVANHYPQSLALNLRIFYTFYNVFYLSHPVSFILCRCLSPSLMPLPSLSIAWGLVIHASLNTAVAVNPI